MSMSGLPIVESSQSRTAITLGSVGCRIYSVNLSLNQHRNALLTKLSNL